ncbi:MAG: CoA-acylating methylmalonate-semialdehyde dehydrogenase [Sphingomonas sp.]|uniref:CoA-acylating methylmalonate-semialdehyde dehydrogenase n=1 Tax=Sphingomonas sp. TaxID=28214 RepID=UPI00258D1A68|nr:CoA-acylating methylmalonate-semialdehyde dehydrogenase [Sphingomonas sp.]MCP4027352.1 CoA-acylating methylmalonate-semialdehyde dehydrogenase [Sphingomonas sp.]
MRIPNYIGGEEVASSATRSMPVTNPGTGEIIAELPLSPISELDAAVKVAAEAQKAWAEITVKDRVQVLFRMKTLMEAEVERLAELITVENGKTMPESRGSILRAVECLEFASSLPQIGTGAGLEVSRGVECRSHRFPLGVTVGITPFNFPLMVPLWMAPLALASGNAFILKPSEQTPLSALELAKLFDRAGLPAGLFSVLNGDREIVEAICDHPGIAAIAFVGSTPVARAVHTRGAAAGKRMRALGGAKNHLVVVPDADTEMTASNVVASVTGCAGQRCMAASVLLAVGEVDHVIDRVREKMAAVVAGGDMGPMISRAAWERVSGYIDRAEAGGATLLLDGRGQVAPDASPEGYWLGPCIIDRARPDHESACDEIFGPVLTIIRCDTLEEALAIENANPYGNAAAIYTSSGKVAQHFVDRAGAGMIGVNIGVPVPREPFAFGGWNDSRIGEGEITGMGAIEFWSRSKKVTSKWSTEHSANWMS